jgi:hypothetical protein
MWILVMLTNLMKRSRRILGSTIALGGQVWCVVKVLYTVLRSGILVLVGTKFSVIAYKLGQVSP